MKKEKVLSTLEEIKTISDPFRLKILLLFDEEDAPMTVKQVAIKLEEVASKVHYHVKELERIGVLEIVETKEKAGIMEKFYSPTAECFKIERSIGTAVNEEDHNMVGVNLFQAMQEDFIRNNKLKKQGENGTLNYGRYYLTEEEAKELATIIREYQKNKTQREGTKPYMFGYALFRKYDREEVVTDGNAKVD
jgi:hypothetical protein